MKKIYKVIVLILIAVCLGIVSRGQSYVEIGNGTENGSFPYTAWKYSWAKTVYNSTQIGGAKSINGLALYSYKAGPFSLANQKVYLKKTTATDVSSSYEDPSTTGYTLAWQGTLSINQIGWVKIDFTAPFSLAEGENLIVLWENRSNSAPYLGIYATLTTSNVIMVSGSDAGFPAVSGYNPYPKAYPNIRFYYESTGPANPDLPNPLNNQIKVNTDASLKFTLTGATSYDLYLGTNRSLVNGLDASVKVASDVAAVTGENTFTPTAPLSDSTKYYWKVVAKKDATTASSAVWCFVTQKVIKDFPYKQGFEATWKSVLNDTLSYVINTNYEDSTAWTFTDNWNISDSKKGHFGIFSAISSGSYQGDWWLMTPRVYLPENYRISFWYRLSNSTDFSKSTNPVYFQISTDGGTTWANVDTLNPQASMKSWEYIAENLVGFNGNNVYMRWLYKVNSTASESFYLDDITISEIPSGAAISLDITNHTYPDIYMNGRMPLDLILRNPGTSNLVITGANSVGPFTCDYSGTIKPGESDTAKVYFAPTAAGNFNGSVEFIASGITEGNKITLSGKGLQVLDKLFESFDASTQIPTTWYTINSPSHLYSKVSIISGTYDANSQPNAIKILCFPEYNYPISLVTPGVTNFGNNKLTFYAKKNDSSYDLDLVIGVMDNPYNVNDFVEIDRIRLTSTYAKYEAFIPANNTKPYIAFRFGGYVEGETSIKSLRIDDISWDTQENAVPNPAIISSPENNGVNIDIMKQLQLKWANGGGNPEGYKVYLGTTTAANELVNGELTTATNTFYNYSGNLQFSKTYYWKIVPYNQTGNAGECPVWSFTTMADPTISTFPYTENFDGITNGPGFTYPLGWSIEDHNNDKMCWDIIANNGGYINAFSAPNAMHVAFNYNAKDDYLYSPPLQLQQGKLYKLSFKLHTMQDGVTGLIYTEKIKVFLGSANLSSTMTQTIADDYVNQDIWKEVSGLFTVDESGKYFLGFYAYSDPEQYLLIIDNVKVEEISEGAPIVDFSASQTAVTAGDIVTLTNSSICNPAANSFEWTITPADYAFENGTDMNSENPQVKFRFSGTYSVGLKVTNNLGSNTKTVDNYITVNSSGLMSPQSLTAAPSSGKVTLNWTLPLAAKLNEGFEGSVTDWSIKKSTAANGSDLVDAVIGTDDTWGIADKAITADFADYVHSGNRSIFINYTAGSGSEPDYSWLISPDVQVASGDKLKYWIAYLNGAAGDGNTYYTLFHIMVNDGTGWTSIFDYNNQSPVNMMQSEVSHDLSSYAGKTVKIAFVYQYNDGYQLSLDDIKVVAGTTKAGNSTKSGSPVLQRIIAKTSILASVREAATSSALAGFKVYRNHQLISTISDPQTTTYVDNGLSAGQYLYQVTALYTSPDGESDPASANVDVTTAIEPNKQDNNSLIVYPNPSKGRFTVKLNTSDSNQELVVSIYNMVGQKIYSKNVNGSANIDLGYVDKGVYIVTARTKDNTISKRIVIE